VSECPHVFVLDVPDLCPHLAQLAESTDWSSGRRTNESQAFGKGELFTIKYLYKMDKTRQPVLEGEVGLFNRVFYSSFSHLERYPILPSKQGRNLTLNDSRLVARGGAGEGQGGGGVWWRKRSI
jgi:hypothetical protein